MTTVNDFVNAIASGNLSQANNMFGELMHDRLSQSLDDKKIEIAQGFGGIDTNEEDTEEDQETEDDEVSEVSGSD